MMLNEDYRDILQALFDEKVKFILMGAYALAAHGYPRATMDIDTGSCHLLIMPKPSSEHYAISVHHCTILLKRIRREDGTVFQIGVAPRRIDIITAATGLTFEHTYQNSVLVKH